MLPGSARNPSLFVSRHFADFSPWMKDEALSVNPFVNFYQALLYSLVRIVHLSVRLSQQSKRMNASSEQFMRA